jgi:cytochrome c oxidase assembly protein subunit 15
MNGQIFPANAGWDGPASLRDDPHLTHFIHRWWAFVTAGALILLAVRAKRAGGRAASFAVHATLGIQILLGIAVVLTGVALWLAVAHQAVGALLVAAAAWALHADGRAGAPGARA